MKTLAKLFSLLLLFLSFSLSGGPDTSNWVKAPENEWHLTLESALEAAKTSGKKVFVFHTGSDWCGWCKKLKKDVLTTPKFRKFVKRNLEFVYLDSPSKRVSMPDAQRNYNNQTWRSLRGGGGVPSALLLDSRGRRLGALSGYRPLQGYLSALEDLVRKAPASQEAPALAPAPASNDSQGWIPAPEGWFNKLEPALEKAKNENKKVLVLSTGSDWCPPCKKFGRICLPSDEFKSFARRNLVLVYIDLPRNKNMLSAQTSYNKKIIYKLDMRRGVPTFTVLDSRGNKVKQFSGFSSTSSFMERLKSAVQSNSESAGTDQSNSGNIKSEQSNPGSFRAGIEDRGKRIEAMRSAKISIEGWKVTPEDPMRPISELPRKVSPGQKIYFYLNYDLPPNMACRIYFHVQGASNKRSIENLTGKGLCIREVTFTFERYKRARFMLIFLQNAGTEILYRRLPCNITAAE